METTLSVHLVEVVEVVLEHLQQVTALGSTTADDIAFENGTDSTSKTTGALIVSGGLGVNNTINAGGDVIAYASSDERLKDNIKPIENPLEVISQLVVTLLIGIVKNRIFIMEKTME